MLIAHLPAKAEPSPQCVQIDFRVNLGGLSLLMPEHLADLDSEAPLAEQTRGQRMAQQMGAMMTRFKSSAFQPASTMPQTILGGLVKPDVGALQWMKHASGGTLRPLFR